MTCVAALVHDKKIYFGGDSAGVGGGYSLTVRADAKVWTKGDFAYGFTTSFRMGNILRYKFTPPEQGRESVETYMNTKFVDALISCFEENKWLGETEGAATGGNFIVGYKGRLFDICSDFQVGMSRVPYEAVGCGFHAALGSLYSTEGQEPKARIRTALKAAEQFSAGVRGPFKIVTLGG